MSSTDEASPPGQKILAARNILALERKVRKYRVEMLGLTVHAQVSSTALYGPSRSLSRKTHELNYGSEMTGSWNRFCFTEGYIEVMVTFPGLSWFVLWLAV